MPNIRAIELEDFITGERQCPSKFIETLASNGVDKELTLNPEFSAWKRFDQFLLGWLLSTISEGLIGQVTECLTSLEAWRTLESMFSQQSMTKVLQLKQQLQGLKKGSSSINDYILKVKGIGDGLRSAGQVVYDRDLLLNVLNGLGHEYDPVVVLVSQQSGITLHEAQYMLMIHEQRIEHLNSVASVDVPQSANFVNNSGGRGLQNNNNRGGSQNAGGRGQNNRGRKGKGRWNNNNTSRPTCQICSRIGHTAAQCYNRYDRNASQPAPPSFTSQGAMQVHTQPGSYSTEYVPNYIHQPVPSSFNQGYFQQGNFQSPSHQVHYNQTSAYIASPEVVADQSWYADSGSSSHVTSDLGNFLTYSAYTGSERLAVDSGDQLQILHIGNTVIDSHSKPITQLKLTNMLHVPHIAKNLLSIYRFVNDNNAVAEFIGHCCVIKDKDSKRMLLQGTLKDGLYQLHLSGGLSSPSVSCFNSANKQSASFVSNHQFADCNTALSRVDFPLYDHIPLSCNVANNKTPCSYNSQTASIWHSKLGHPSSQTLQQVLK
ncbi:hypothetical protein ACOSP7_025385 [Xanthoceras sorbifolium]